MKDRIQRIISIHILDLGRMPTISEVRDMLDEIPNSTHTTSYWIRHSFGVSRKMAAEFARQIGDEDEA